MLLAHLLERAPTSQSRPRFRALVALLALMAISPVILQYTSYAQLSPSRTYEAWLADQFAARA